MEDTKMRVLLTGGSGMVGRNVLEHLAVSKYQIFAPSHKELDLLDESAIIKYIKKHNIQWVVHCAGMVGGIHTNMMDQANFLNTNLLMGMNLINASFKSGVRNLINLASSCMYPKDYKNPIKEEYLLQAGLESTNEGYALAKITVAKYCEFMTKQNGVNYKTLIPCNLYGRFDKFDPKLSHMLPAVINKIHQAKELNQPTVEIWGDGLAKREFLYAADVADSIFFAIDNFDKFDYYTNIGLGYDHSINDYYHMVAKIIGYKGDFTHNLAQPVGVMQKLSDISKLTALGWAAKYDLEAGIKATYEYYLTTIKA